MAYPTLLIMNLDPNQNYFVTAIHTDSGKTYASAYLCEQFGFDYWKPIQAGEDTDSNAIKNLVKRKGIKIFPETYALKTPISPHKAAEIDGIKIDLSKIKIPQSNKGIIVEGAGGVLVPLNQEQTMTDLMLHLGLPVILVINFYLGSINHSLLTIEYLKSKNIVIEGVIFNGKQTESSKEIITQLGRIKILGEIPYNGIK